MKFTISATFLATVALAPVATALVASTNVLPVCGKAVLKTAYDHVKCRKPLPVGMLHFLALPLLFFVSQLAFTLLDFVILFHLHSGLINPLPLDKDLRIYASPLTSIRY